MRRRPRVLPVTSPAGDTITVGDMNQSTGVAIGADVRATVYIDGRQDKTSDELLAAYYQRLAQRCRSAPLQEAYEQRGATGSLSTDLDQVYTQLATTASVEREHFTGAALASFDSATFLDAHTGLDRLPSERRTAFQVEGDARTKQGSEERETFGLDKLTNLESMKADDLAQYVCEADRVIFLDPQLVSEAIAAAPRLVLLGEPGSGKSTALRYLAYTLAGAGLDPQVDGEAEDLWDYLADQLQPKGANSGLATAIHEEIETSRVILLLDGLDEVAGAESRRKVVVRAVQVLRRALLDWKEAKS
ncbi:MAG: hypothetical protein MI924_01910 [Chloroflexales bacterium]|nr:hypothetical protein [Chloroflexales bacterium]